MPELLSERGVTDNPDAPMEDPIEVHITLTITRPGFGGLRWWFVCPGAGCGRRVSKLWLPVDGTFACRICHDLTYKNCQERHVNDAMYAMLAERVGISPAEAHRLLMSHHPGQQADATDGQGPEPGRTRENRPAPA